MNASAPASTRVPLAVALLLLVVVLVAWIGRARDGRGLVDAADAALARGDRTEAIVFARAAAEARCPGCSAPDLGYGRLELVAADAERRGDDATAVAAWRAVRSATLATTLLSRTSDRRTRADAEIARLEHRIDAAAAAVSGAPTATPAATEERIRAALEDDTVPSGMVFLVIALGGALFFLGAIRFVRASRFAALDLGLGLLGGGIAALGVMAF